MIELVQRLPRDESVAAISLRPQWATAVTWLGKDVENRSNWPFAYRGPIVIHASARSPYREELQAVLAIAREGEVSEQLLELLNPDSYVLELMPQGAIVAVANLSEVFRADAEIQDDHPAVSSPGADNDAKYWLYFDEVVPVKPTPYKGRVGFFKVPYTVVAELESFAFSD